MSAAFDMIDNGLFDDLDRLIEASKTAGREDFAPVAEAIRNAIRENFESESGDGQRWRRLAKRTVEERITLGFPGEHPILRRTDSLLDSLINPSNSRHIEIVESSGDLIDLAVGSSDERVPKLDQGEGSIPARPFLVADSRQEDRIANAVDRYFESLLGG